MQDWQKPTGESRKIGVLLFENFSNHCLANGIEPLRAANMLLRRPVYDWRFMTLDGAPVVSSSGLPVQAEAALGDGGPGDVLFVISSYGFKGLVTTDVLRGLRAAAGRYRVVVGLDTGSWLLAAAGLLDGVPATIHWEEFERFREAFPEVVAQRRRVLRGDSRWSCGGAMTAFELVGEMIAADHGEALRLEVAALFMTGEAAAEPGDGMARPASGQVAAALAVMRENLEEPLSIPGIAARLGLGQRRLERLFHDDLGHGPRRAYGRLRLLAARRFVQQSGLGVAEIALRCGYGDASAMTRAFRREFGTTPRGMRGAGSFPD